MKKGFILCRALAIACLIPLLVACASTTTVVSLSPPRAVSGDVQASAVYGDYLVLLYETGLVTCPLSALTIEGSDVSSLTVDSYSLGKKNTWLLSKGTSVYFGGDAVLGWASINDDGNIGTRGSLALAGGIQGLASEGDHLYVISGTNLLSYKLNNDGSISTSEPESKQGFVGRVSGIASKPGMLAVSMYCYGVDFYDLGDPARPKLVKAVKTGGHPESSGVFYRDYFVFSNEFAGFQAIDLRTFAEPFTFFNIMGLGASITRIDDSLYVASKSGFGVWKIDGTAVSPAAALPKGSVKKLAIASKEGIHYVTTTGIAGVFSAGGRLYGLRCKNRGSFFELDGKGFKDTTPDILESVAPDLATKEDGARLYLSSGFTLHSLNGRPVSYGIAHGDERVFRVVYVPEGQMDISYTFKSYDFKSKGTLKDTKMVYKGRTYVLTIAPGMTTAIVDMDARSGR